MRGVPTKVSFGSVYKCNSKKIKKYDQKNDPFDKQGEWVVFNDSCSKECGYVELFSSTRFVERNDFFNPFNGHFQSFSNIFS